LNAANGELPISVIMVSVINWGVIALNVVIPTT